MSICFQVQFESDDDSSRTVSVLEEIKRVTLPAASNRELYSPEPLGFPYAPSPYGGLPMGSTRPLPPTNPKPDDNRPKLTAGARVG